MGSLFGTDGVRGIANDVLTCEMAMQIGRATAGVLTRSNRRRPLIVVGMDPRLSSDMLSSALTAGLCSVGADVISLGVVPTPAVAYLVVKYKADAGVMISASHNSSEFNGIKIFSGDGYKLPDEMEEQIEMAVLDRSREAVPLAKPVDIGKVSYRPQACKDYVDHLKSTVSYSLDGLRIAVDCANGAASKTARKLFTELGAECDYLFESPDGININHECGSTHMEALRLHVMENNLDAGVAFDGDADRCLMIDSQGNLFDGDFIMAICALDMKQRGKLNRNTVVGTIMTNLGFIRFCEENGLAFVSTKVGDRFVLEEMLLEEYDFGGEQSGHVIFRDFATTGDGQLTAIQLLSILKREKKQLSELWSIMERYPQKMINVKVTPEGRLSFYTNHEIKHVIEQAKKALGPDGRIVVRVSGTEPLIRVMVEGKDPQIIDALSEQVAEVIRSELAER